MENHVWRRASLANVAARDVCNEEIPPSRLLEDQFADLAVEAGRRGDQDAAIFAPAERIVCAGDRRQIL